MAYEFDKMSINGTQIDAKDKTARDEITTMKPDLKTAKATGQEALNLASSQSIVIADNTENINTLRTNLQKVTETVNQMQEDEFQELNYTLQPEFTLKSYGWITCVRSGKNAIISFYGVNAVNTSTNQGMIRLSGYKAKKPVATVLYDNTAHTAEAMRISDKGNLILALRTTAGDDYLGMMIVPIEEA